MSNNYTSYTGSNIVGDVSYDAFLSSQADLSAPHDYEIMVWLAALGGAEPIGYTNLIASPNIGGVDFNLYAGPNGWTVYSFVATSQQNNFNGNIMDFFNFLIDHEGLPSSYYLQVLQAGTEAFTGEGAEFTVSPYQIQLIH
jgi:xyloglucan-specific endo-beta-1,4-glucanase